ncbi:RHS repeat-associated protein [Bradymonas sediminis]|nr:RHS repeat-associated protein [Bradymonas sediminis]
MWILPFCAKNLWFRARLDASGAVAVRYVYATRAYVPDLILKDNRTYRVITDHLGSVRLVVDAADGTVMQRLEYDAFGNIIADTNPGFQPFGFAGGIHDPLTELIHFGHRDYDPRARRWTTPDPTGFGGGTVNLYLYGANDPLQFVDPNGEAVVVVTLVVAAAVVGYAYSTLVHNTALNSGNEAGEVLDGYGVDKGPTDALRHCTMNCNMRRKHGFEFAVLASWYHEVPEQWAKFNFENTPDFEPRQMDEHNNVCGRLIARVENSKIPCVEHCKNALIEGRLKMMPESLWCPPEADCSSGKAIWDSWRHP